MPPNIKLLDESKESAARTFFHTAGSANGSIKEPTSAESTDGKTVKTISSSSNTVKSDDSSLLDPTSSLRTSELRKTKETERSFSYHGARSSASPAAALNCESIPLIGREQEVSTLKSCYTRMIEASSTTREKELVLINGQSGSGKSSVAQTLQEEISKHPNAVFVEGKFDMNTSSEPYSGICKAFRALCQKMKEVSPQELSAAQAIINEQLGSEVDLLIHLIPGLKELIGNSINTPTIEDIGEVEIESKLERFRFAFRVLTRAFSSVFSPLVFFLDDLQWADVSSLQVLDFLISDTRNKHEVMFVGSYRSEEVNENSLLYTKVMRLREMSEKYRFNLTSITVGNFAIEGIEQIISTILPTTDKAASSGLAAICLKRTLGNPFFVLEFLKMLHHEGMLKHDAASNTWDWNVKKIDDATMSTANVVVMLHKRLTELPKQVQSLLQCAAYLGSSFSESTIDLVWSTFGRRLVESKLEPSTSLLQVIVEEEIMEKCGENQFKWVHDKLQEAALSLTGKRRESFQLDIGRTLYYGLDKQQVEDELFTIVDLINNGNILNLAEFASANLRAADKARALSAFQAAADYVAQGVNLLGEDRWSNNHEVTLKLYTMGAEMEVMLGNVDASNRYSEEALQQSGLSVLEVLPLKIAKAMAIGSTDLKFDESVKYYLKLLDELGCRVAWKRSLVPVQAIMKLLKLIKRIKATPQSFYDKMVPIEDPRQKAIASVCSKLVYYAYMAGEMFLLVLGTCKLVEITLDHGLNEYSAKSFSSLGSAVVISSEDFETCARLNHIALSMLKKFRGMHHSETTFLIYGPSLSWVKPFEELAPPMRDAITEGLRSGDTEYAVWNLITSKILIKYIIGAPMDSILEDIGETLLQCEDAAQTISANVVKIFWQMMKNLQYPPSSNPTALEGDIFSASKDDETNNVHLANIHFAEGELLLFNGDYEAAALRALKVGDSFSKLMPGFLLNMVDFFHRAVPLYAAARQTKKRKYRGEARRLLKKIGKWANCGNANVQYYFLFLTAEQLALEKKYDLAQAKYKEAIEAATATCHLHHIGLINERYADFLLHDRVAKEESKERLTQAIECYKEWGAAKKVAELEARL